MTDNAESRLGLVKSDLDLGLRFDLGLGLDLANTTECVVKCVPGS